MKVGIRELLFIAVMVGLMAASYFLVFTKATAKRQARQTEIDRKYQALSDLERAKSDVKDVDLKIRELFDATRFFESKLPKGKEIENVLPEVSRLAEANGLITKTVKPAKPQRMNGYSEQPIEMSLSGSFTGFYQFLLQLERLPRLTRLTRMDLTKITDHDGDMQASLTLSIFFEPETTEATASTN